MLFSLSCSSQDKTIDIKFNMDLFSWTTEINRSSDDFFLDVDGEYIIIRNYLYSKDTVYFNIMGDSIISCLNCVHNKREAHLANYKSAQIFVHDSTEGETSTYYPITLKDSSVVTELKLEAYRQKTRGVNNEYALHFKDAKGIDYKLTFPTDENKGAISIYDVVSYDATRVVISFWYYERWGVSNTQLGVLDLSQFLRQ